MQDMADCPVIERIHCNACRQNTRHQLLCKTVDTEDDDLPDGPTIEWTITHETFQCCGCGAAVLRRTAISEIEDWNSIQYFPPAISRHPPSWRWECPTQVHEVMTEVYRSLDANNRRLPMMGARTLVDMLMVDKVGDIGSFDDKLKKLEGLGVISRDNREVLSAALDVGHAAAHRGHAPATDDVNAVMDIVENLLHDPQKMSQVDPVLASAMLSHGTGITLSVGGHGGGASGGIGIDTSKVNEYLYARDVQKANQATRDYVTAMAGAHEAITQLPRLQTFGQSSRMTQQQMETAQQLLPQPGDGTMAPQKMRSLQGMLDPLRKQVPHMPGAETIPSWMERQQQQQRQTPSGGSTLGQMVGNPVSRLVPSN